MTSISTIIDTVRSKTGTLLSTRTEFPNPYSLEDNPESLIVNGYGIRIDESIPSVNSEICKHNEQQTLTIILIEKMYKSDTNPDGAYTTAKSLKEDAMIIKRDFNNGNELGIHTDIEKLEWTGDSEIDFVIAKKFNFMFIEISYNFSLRETYTTI